MTDYINETKADIDNAWTIHTDIPPDGKEEEEEEEEEKNKNHHSNDDACNGRGGETCGRVMRYIRAHTLREP